MCGIFGLIVKPGSAYPAQSIRKAVKKLALLSESRGKDSSGVAFRFNKQSAIEILKGDIPVSSLLDAEKYDSFFQHALDEYNMGEGLQIFGHARLVTNGSQLQEENNQPVIKDNMAVIHNGIITNVNELWAANKDIKQDYKIDTEVIPALIAQQLKKSEDTVSACNQTFNKLQGTFSVALMFGDRDEFVLATNNGSLYYVTNNSDFIFFASEKYYITQLIESSEFHSFNSAACETKQLKANEGQLIHLNAFVLDKFKFASETKIKNSSNIHSPLAINVHAIENKEHKTEVVIDPAIFINRNKEEKLFKLIEFNIDEVKKLKRCSKCLLPETFPFISFNANSVCNYCENYQTKKRIRSLDEFLNIIEPFRSKNGEPDCLVPFSGGRDSSFALHYIVKELKLKPVTFTFDWGMVTDLARRNVARVSGKLGVENIIVAANLRTKRENIKKNVTAWLKKPDLGMIPLFMAGDKEFHKHARRLKKQLGVSLNIWGENHLENTDFKIGFSGVRPVFNKATNYSLKFDNVGHLVAHIAHEFITNPAYFNSSLYDNFQSSLARFLPKENYYNFFDFFPWDEKTVENTIINQYGWEKAIDTDSTWRIGDGTAAFYNYIYFTVAGFSEFDTFRSNQIREGMITREEGLKLIEKENFPRYESLRWYLEIIRLDFNQVIERVNSIPKLYPL